MGRSRVVYCNIFIDLPKEIGGGEDNRKEPLQELDDFEFVPFVYDRCLVDVELFCDGATNREENVNVYMLNGFKKELLEKEMFSDYSFAASSVKLKSEVNRMSRDEIKAVLSQAVKEK